MLDMFFIPWTPCLCHRKCRCCRAARKRFRALVCLAPSLHRPSGPQESLRTWFASKFCAAIKSLFQHQCFRIITWIYFYVFTYFCKTPCNMCLSAILLGHSVRNLTDYRCDASQRVLRHVSSFQPFPFNCPWFDGSYSMDLIHFNA